MEDQEPLIDAREAVKYLAQIWDMESYSMEAFNKLRQRRNIEPPLKSKTATFWRKSDLDKIPRPDRSRSRPSRKRKTNQEDDEGGAEGTTSMLTTDIRNYCMPIPEEEIPDLSRLMVV